MIKSNSSFSYEELEGNVLLIRLDGEIDHHGAVGIRIELDEMIFEKRPQKVILDLSGISFMDSSGLGLIMGRYTLLKDFGGTLTLKDPTQAILKILKLAGMEKVIKIEKGEKD